MARKSTKKREHYVDNKKFYGAMIHYLNEYNAAKESGEELPRVTEYLGECFYKIAEGQGERYNFRGYSYLEEMKMDGIMDCLKYIHNFDPDKYNNPFAYFSRIIWQAFVRRINLEQKEQYTKYKISMNLLGEYPTEHTKEMQEKISTLEEKFEPKKKRGAP